MLIKGPWDEATLGASNFTCEGPQECSSKLNYSAPTQHADGALLGSNGQERFSVGACICPVINHPARGQIQGWKWKMGGVGMQRRWSFEDIRFLWKEGMLKALLASMLGGNSKRGGTLGQLQAGDKSWGVGERKGLIRLQVSSAFQKFPLHHFAFTKDLHDSLLFSLTERNPKRIFVFMGEKSQREHSIQCSFCVAPPAPPREPGSGAQHQAP